MKINDIIDLKTFKYKWDIIETIPEFAKLKECEQNPKWHGEGNAWIHTQKVCAEAEKICHERGWYNETNWARELLVSALFHDIGKTTTTTYFKDNWHSYGHEISGEKITRRLLWDEGFTVRESICALVRWHMEPLSIFNNKNYIDKIVNLSKDIPSWHMLLLLKKCDILGSHPYDKEVTRIDLLKIEDLIHITSCLNCYYMETEIPNKQYLLHNIRANNKKNIDVYMLIGLPGAGKSTVVEKISQNIKGPYSIISRDIARYELGFCKQGEKMVGNSIQEKEVTNKCNEMILISASLGETIIIDNTNLKKSYRDAYHSLLEDYNAKWIYIYVEAKGLEKNLKRREGQIKQEVFDNMICNFDWPTVDEFNEIKFFDN